jgi:glycerol-3-phosphate dehydrogenase (NAD(P)+)
MNSSNKVAILGAGNWGTVLAILACKAQEQKPNPCRIFLYDYDSDKIKNIARTGINEQSLPGVQLPAALEYSDSLELVLSECLVLVPVVPSKVMRDFSRKFAPYVRGDHLMIHGTKGFEPLTHKRMSQVISEETGCLRVGVLAGPNLANELAAGLPSATVIASPFEEVQQVGMQIFHSEKFSVEQSSDLVGVELISALKNILALASGFCAEMKLGQNAMGTVLTNTLKESITLMKALGAKPETAFSLAGFGDILATSTSDLSRNFRAGKLLASGKTQVDIENSLKSTVEGLSTLKAARELAGDYSKNLPIITSLWNLSQGVGSPNDASARILTPP